MMGKCYELILDYLKEYEEVGLVEFVESLGVLIEIIWCDLNKFVD